MDVYRQLMIEKNGNLEHDRINEVIGFIWFLFLDFLRIGLRLCGKEKS
jgi:hypothetical protein